MSGKTLVIHHPQLQGNRLTCTYTVGTEVFESSYALPGVINKKFPELQKLCEWVAVVTALGLFSVDYFGKLQIDFELSKQETDFFEKLIFLGLGEFRFINKIPLDTKTRILGDHPPIGVLPKKNSSVNPSSKPLLLNGGGKDGSVSALLLNELGVDFTWFQRGDSTAQSNVVKAWDKPVLIVQRQLDPKRKGRKYSGHRPMSAGIAFLAILAAKIYGYTEVIASNELSANEANFKVDNFQVNHQYSKSLEFEKDIQDLIGLFGIDVRYFSLLRPLHELQIAILASGLTIKQLQAITSCNNGTKTGQWCMACAKCAFVVLTITAASLSMAEKIWGKQAINKPSLLPYFKELLDPKMPKPLECVGMLDECQLAAYLILKNQDVYLESSVHNIFSKFATGENFSLLEQSGDSLIPADYQKVVGHMKKHLTNWQKRYTAGHDE